MSVCLCVGGYIFNTEAHPVDAASLYCCSSEKTRDDAAVNSMMTNVDLLSTLDIFSHHSQQPSPTPPGLVTTAVFLIV